MSLRPEECIISDEALDAVIKKYENTSGIRDLEQAAEHIAAHALYLIEVDHLTQVVYDAQMVNELLS
jgi:ATP-dependent Lon protease